MQKPQALSKCDDQALAGQGTKEETQEHEAMMRRFIRHPSDIPISFDILNCKNTSTTSPLINVSRGGLSFYSAVPIPKGAEVRITIPIQKPAFEATGSVAWCKIEDDQFVVGLAFDDLSAGYSVRMVEQVCYIERYRALAASCEGRHLSSEEAAEEWIDKYAKDFPRH